MMQCAVTQKGTRDTAGLRPRLASAISRQARSLQRPRRRPLPPTRPMHNHTRAHTRGGAALDMAPHAHAQSNARSFAAASPAFDRWIGNVTLPLHARSAPSPLVRAEPCSSRAPSLAAAGAQALLHALYGADGRSPGRLVMSSRVDCCRVWLDR